MIKKFFSLPFLIFLSSLNVHAEIDKDVFGPNGQCTQQTFSFSQSGNIYVADALECGKMYDGYYLVELAVANAAPEKEIYAVQRLGKSDVVKETTGYYVNSQSDLLSASSGAALYLGKTSGGYDSILVKLYKPFGPSISPVTEFYVKMDGMEVYVKDLVMSAAK
jgi:hypothetical protein